MTLMKKVLDEDVYIKAIGTLLWNFFFESGYQMCSARQEKTKKDWRRIP